MEHIKSNLTVPNKKIKQIRQYFASNTAPGLSPDSAELVFVENYDTNGLLLEKISFTNGDSTIINYNYYDSANKLSVTRLYDCRAHKFAEKYQKRFDACGHLTLDMDFNEVHRYGYRYDSGCNVVYVTDTFRSSYSFFSQNNEKPYTQVKIFNKADGITSIFTTWQYENNGVFVDLNIDTTIYKYTYNSKMKPVENYCNGELVSSFSYTGFDSLLSMQTYSKALPAYQVTYYYDSFHKNIGTVESTPYGKCTTFIYNTNGRLKEIWHYTNNSFIPDPEEIKRNKKYTLYTLCYDYY